MQVARCVLSDCVCSGFLKNIRWCLQLHQIITRHPLFRAFNIARSRAADFCTFAPLLCCFFYRLSICRCFAFDSIVCVLPRRHAPHSVLRCMRNSGLKQIDSEKVRLRLCNFVTVQPRLFRPVLSIASRAHRITRASHHLL